MITIEDGEQKAGYLRYYPTTDFSTEYFTGRIQVLSINHTENYESYIENGVTIQNESNGNQTFGISKDCETTIVIGSTVCSNGGKHRYGVPCTGKGAVNDAYLYVTSYTTCVTTITSDVIAFPMYIMDMNPNRGGGGGSNSINLRAEENAFMNLFGEWLNRNVRSKGTIFSCLSSNKYSNKSKQLASQLIHFIENDPVLNTENNLIAEFIVRQILYVEKYNLEEFKNFWNNLTPEEKQLFQDYANANKAVSTPELKISAQAFLGWAFPYLIDNPNVTIAQFENWFMVNTNGKDGDYDANYWENPNLVIQQQNLPSYDDFYNEFPLKNGGVMPSPEAYQLVGGQLYNNHLANPSGYSNACAIRVSRALNYSGVIVPNIPGQTEKGADNKNYFLSAKNLNAWMEKTFGKPTGSNRLTGAQGGINGENYPNLLQNKQGVYIMIANYPGPSYFGATGHADIMENGTCPDDRCYFNAKGGVHFINVWELN